MRREQRIHERQRSARIYARRDIAEAHVLEWLQQPYKEDIA